MNGYNQEHARRAIRNCMTRAKKHVANERLDLAQAALASGAKTAKSWLDGTHPQAQ